MRLRTIAVLLLTPLLFANGQFNAVEDALGALERGNLTSAEQTLRAELKVHPTNVEALDLLGVVLDNEKKYSEADGIYRRALNAAPPSAGLLNNYGNHLVAEGRLKDAKPVFLKVVGVNPSHANAHVQLARIAVQADAPNEALAHLDRLPASAKQNYDVAILKMEALYQLQRNREADAMLAEISSASETDSHLSGAIGVALAFVKQYAQASAFLSRAVDAQPQNVDLLYELASVDVHLDREEPAVQLLARAAQISPERAEVQFLLARTTAELGYFGDAVQAWNSYIALVPNDDAAKRERGFAETALGVNVNSGIADLAWFVKRHPNDPVGHYEMGVAENATDPAAARKEFDRALALKPEFIAAHIGRAILFYRQGNAQAALPDLEFAVGHEPQNASVLDRLGETYLVLDRSADAVRVLHRAAELAPRDPIILMHLGRALSKAGQKEEAKAVMARFRELGPERSAAHPAGLIDFLALPPAEQYARYRAGVERTVHAHPENAAAQLEYLKLLLADQKTDQVETIARQIIALKPALPLLVDAGNALISAQQYALAKSFLEETETLAGPDPSLRLDLAIVASHVDGPQAGLKQLDQIPEPQRTGDYYLARADMLEATGHVAEAETAVQSAIARSPTRPDLYRECASFLTKDDRSALARQLLDKALRVLPDDPEIQMLHAKTIELAGKSEDVRR